MLKHEILPLDEEIYLDAVHRLVLFEQCSVGFILIWARRGFLAQFQDGRFTRLVFVPQGVDPSLFLGFQGN